MSPQRILVVKLSALGDFVLAFAPLAAIRKAHPGAQISLLTTRIFADIAHQCPWADEVIVDQRPGIFDVSGWLRLRRRLRGGKFDRVYDLQTNDRTAFYRRLMGPVEWVGVCRGADFRLTRADWKQMHALDRHREMLALAGIEKMPAPDMSWLDADISLFRLKKPYVLLVPGSAPQHPGKRWPAQRYAGLAKSLEAAGYTVALLGTRDEAEATRAIVKICPEAADLTGQTTLFDIAALGRQAFAAIGNDTGPMHLIAASGCPSLVLFSDVSDPERSAPRGDKVTVLQCDDLSALGVAEVYKTFKELTGV